MELYDRLRNVMGKNNEEELIKAIAIVKEKLSKLTEERMCKVYNGYLLNELRNFHVPSRMINTLDLGLSYEHVFILVLKNDMGYMLVDLTFSQFSMQSERFTQLLEEGYQSVDDIDLNCYLSIVSGGKNLFGFSLENVFSYLDSNRVIR